MTDQDIWRLRRGGHDYRKVHAAYDAATKHKGQPTVILVKTIKGFGLGPSFQGRNATHQMKKMTMQNLKEFRDSLHLPITDSRLEENLYNPPYYNPGEDSDEIRYMKDRRAKLGGFVPERRVTAKPLVLPGDKVYDVLKQGSGKQEIATTMAFVRLVRDLFKDPEIGNRVVPIIPDEARTFGMDAFFPTQKIYNPSGQLYTAVDAQLMLAYRESEQGMILHEGIDEAGSTATFTAVATSYATHGENIMYYITLYNEPYQQPKQPDGLDVDGLLKGIYKLSPAAETEGKARAQLLASGVGVRWALEAQQLLAQDWGVAADVWSVTSWTELSRDAERVERARLLDPAAEVGVPYISKVLAETEGPVIATSDWQRAVQNLIAPWVPGDFVALGADGFGFSDTRAAARRHFLIDGPSMVVATLAALERRGAYRSGAAAEAAEKYELHDVLAGRSGNAGGDS
jgi:pyruvate dehydrogenase complex dehydrogenase (E1) component